jgi:hypothetical protein
MLLLLGPQTVKLPVASSSFHYRKKGSFCIESSPEIDNSTSRDSI